MTPKQTNHNQKKKKTKPQMCTDPLLALAMALLLQSRKLEFVLAPSPRILIFEAWFGRKQWRDWCRSLGCPNAEIRTVWVQHWMASTKPCVQEWLLYKHKVYFLLPGCCLQPYKSFAHGRKEGHIPWYSRFTFGAAQWMLRDHNGVLGIWPRLAICEVISRPSVLPHQSFMILIGQIKVL